MEFALGDIAEPGRTEAKAWQDPARMGSPEEREEKEKDRAREKKMN